MARKLYIHTCPTERISMLAIFSPLEEYMKRHPTRLNHDLGDKTLWFDKHAKEWVVDESEEYGSFCHYRGKNIRDALKELWDADALQKG
jgi:hypothetical protein